MICSPPDERHLYVGERTHDCICVDLCEEKRTCLARAFNVSLAFQVDSCAGAFPYRTRNLSSTVLTSGYSSKEVLQHQVRRVFWPQMTFLLFSSPLPPRPLFKWKKEIISSGANLRFPKGRLYISLATNINSIKNLPILATKVGRQFWNHLLYNDAS